MKLENVDIQLLEKKGITEARLQEQLDMIAKGFPWLNIKCAATPGNGISVLSPEMTEGAIRIWDEFLCSGGSVLKMVPASGAASRMFKDIFAFVNGNDDKPHTHFLDQFFTGIEHFAFFPQLNAACVRLYGKSALTLIGETRFKDVAKALVNPEGLNYGQLPKALLRFHNVLGTSRTALEEHLAEGAQYAAGAGNMVRAHFTVSPDHLELVKQKVEEMSRVLANQYGVSYEVTYSIQKPSTDTVAANKDNTPYREKGHLFFRPGGHGALIENLNDLDADVIFIKNIDNVVPDLHRPTTITYKKVIGGVLVGVKKRADEYCRLIKEGKPSSQELDTMIHFMRDVLHITHDNADKMTDAEKADYIYRKLNRPFRVAGMVRNEGEPGGGPYLVYNQDGTVSPQILESTQINTADAGAKEMMQKATHFNPVDLAVCTKDWQGNKFDLPRYVDKATGFISEKSREGVEIKALELPGLWNGAMSDWNTIFVEVPAETFNPVKTVNDLLRPVHQIS